MHDGIANDGIGPVEVSCPLAARAIPVPGWWAPIDGGPLLTALHPAVRSVMAPLSDGTSCVLFDQGAEPVEAVAVRVPVDVVDVPEP